MNITKNTYSVIFNQPSMVETTFTKDVEGEGLRHIRYFM